MKRLKKIAWRILQLTVVVYLLICVGLYVCQEKIIFHPSPLAANFAFDFEQPFEEISLTTKDEETLNGLLFKNDTSKGLVFYLHGNAGTLRSWGNAAKTYTDLGHDIFLLDYRGFGKSTGAIYSETQFYEDVQLAYDWAKERYSENKITIIGYSIGTGAAAMLAAQNSPKQLILQAPYYSLTDMMQQHYAFVPTFLLKYRFATNTFIPNIKAPIAIFHGNRDYVISMNASLKLKKLFKPRDQLIILSGARHNRMNSNADYLNALKTLL